VEAVAQALGFGVTSVDAGAGGKSTMQWSVPFFAAFFVSIPIAAQTPSIFDLSKVTVGKERAQTLYLFAQGKWSDVDDRVGSLSTEVHCYQRFGFCEVASVVIGGGPNVLLSTFDILRWDNQEIIATDSSPICVVNTLRTDLGSKTVTLSSSAKSSADPSCKGSDKLSTAFLLGWKDLEKLAIEKAKSEK
jgi:hypothetical protein